MRMKEVQYAYRRHPLLGVAVEKKKKEAFLDHYPCLGEDYTVRGEHPGY